MNSAQKSSKSSGITGCCSKLINSEKKSHPNYKEKAIAAAADSDLVMEVHSTAVPDTLSYS